MQYNIYLIVRNRTCAVHIIYWSWHFSSLLQTRYWNCHEASHKFLFLLYIITLVYKCKTNKHFRVVGRHIYYIQSHIQSLQINSPDLLLTLFKTMTQGQVYCCLKDITVSLAEEYGDILVIKLWAKTYEIPRWVAQFYDQGNTVCIL